MVDGPNFVVYMVLKALVTMDTQESPKLGGEVHRAQPCSRVLVFYVYGILWETLMFEHGHMGRRGIKLPMKHTI